LSLSSSSSSSSYLAEYENGKAIPNPEVLNKLDKALGVHLPRQKKK
jgi:transcriptional regulator with XRE-family HTH domain